MSAKDLHVLRSYLARLSVQQLSDLRETRDVLPHLRPVNPANPQATIDEILCTLRSIRPKTRQLRRLASVYSWLIPQNLLPSWFLYRVDPMMAALGDFSLYKRLAFLIRMRCSPASLVCMASPTGAYGCIVALDPDSAQRNRHSVLPMYTWRGVPFMAVCISGLQSVRRFRHLLTEVFERNHEEQLVGFYADIDGAFAAALQEVQSGRV
ncbi:hypothetical protein HPB52_020271 [Rhipicephalus sanguineus]|uniref:Uncharacterized protein n=1 Tax=Rhipicephalus sanguineus TaxID=34632 RepID=A0A9D4PHS9_RHISA|nr:hypothetical protein HPB52_020271 [Rhipicephalus sanguineus]